MITLVMALNNYAGAQSFDYSLVKDSSSYESLLGATSLLNNAAFRTPLGIKLPFMFNANGSTTDSLIIETNGFIVLNRFTQFSIASLSAFRCNMDSSNSYSSQIVYATTGTAGSRIFKIQFVNFSISQLSSSDYLGYQVWLYEGSNKIEFHIGSNSHYDQKENASLLGLINRNMDGINKAYLISGEAGAETGALVSNEDPFVYIWSVPSEGRIFTLIPN